MNMKKWLTDTMAAEKRKSIPVLSFPCTQLLGITVKELIASSDVQAKGMAAVAEHSPTAASVSFMDLSVEAECFGAEIRFSDDEVPNVIGAVVHDEDEAKALKVPEFGAGRSKLYVDAIAKSLKLITDRPIFAGVIGPFSLAGRLMDMTEIMVNCYDEPDMVHITLEKATEFLMSYIKEYKRIGAHGVVMAEPAAGLLSPSLCAEFSSPYIKKIVDAFQDENFLVIYHNCGPTVSRMVPEILSTGSAAYHFGNAVDMKEMMEKMPSDVLTMGNVDPVSIIRNGTPESVREDTLRIMNDCCKYKNFLISTGCDVPPVAPWDNIDAFFAAVDEFYSR